METQNEVDPGRGAVHVPPRPLTPPQVVQYSAVVGAGNAPRGAFCLLYLHSPATGVCATPVSLLDE